MSNQSNPGAELTSLQTTASLAEIKGDSSRKECKASIRLWECSLTWMQASREMSTDSLCLQLISFRPPRALLDREETKIHPSSTISRPAADRASPTWWRTARSTNRSSNPAKQLTPMDSPRMEDLLKETMQMAKKEQGLEAQEKGIQIKRSTKSRTRRLHCLALRSSLG